MGKHHTLSMVLAIVIGVGLLAVTTWFFFQRDTFGNSGFIVGLALSATVAAYLVVAVIRSRAFEGLIDTSVHDLRLANERLEQQKNLLESILDNLGDGVAVADMTGNLSLFNPAAERILGLGRVDSGPEEWSEVYGLLDPDSGEPIPAEQLPLARAIQGEECRDVEMLVRNPHRKGDVFIRVTATPLKDSRGVSLGGVAVFHDINERKWSEALLRESEARFRSIVEATASALIILSSEHRIQEFNPQAERVFGLSRADALGRDFLEVCLPLEYREAVGLDIRQVLAGNPTPGFEVPVQANEQAERTLLWSFSRLVESGDREAVVIATGHDITERRQAEDARRVRELAAHLQSAREAERKHLAREIHDELGQVLTGLKLEVSFLCRRAGGENSEFRTKLREFGRMIDGSIASVRRLATDLRPHILDELGMLEAIRWQVDEFQQRTGIPCDVELPGEEIDWGADRATAMFRILQESLTNVVRHAGATRTSVRVTRSDDRIILEVTDDGRGITEDQVEHSRSFGLLGMQERARMFGGTLRIKAGEEHGTTVVLSMPY